MALTGYTIIQRTNYYEIHGAWVFQACLVRLPDGTTTHLGLPSHRLGAA